MKSQSIELDKETLYKEYYINKKGHKQIAKEYGYKSSNSISQKLRKWNIPKRENLKWFKKSLTKEFLIQKYLVEKISAKDIAKSMGFKSKKSVLDKLREYGIPIRYHEHGDKVSLARFGGYKEISGKYWSSVKLSAFRRSIDFNISIKQAWDLYERQNGKCALTGLDIIFYKKSEEVSKTTCSLDRIDSLKPYDMDNVHWVHKDVNRMKWILSMEDFIRYCSLVVKHRGA